MHIPHSTKQHTNPSHQVNRPLPNKPAENLAFKSSQASENEWDACKCCCSSVRGIEFDGEDGIDGYEEGFEGTEESDSEDEGEEGAFFSPS